MNKDKQEIEVPNIGMTLSRALMPQFDDPRLFLRHLKDKFDVKHTVKNLDTKDLKSTQSDFDDLKVSQMMFSGKPKKPILVSTDGHILDGHHRWLADHNTTGKVKAYVIDHPVLELRKKAQDFASLNEEITHKEFGPMIDSFVTFASDKLGIKSIPSIKYKDGKENFTSFGGYNPSESSIVIATKNRHPMDIYRTLAHELVHHKQNEDGRIKDVSKEGATGSPIEDEANAVAGKIMRWFAKANPENFDLTNLVENKAVFVVGVPCSGKDFVVRQLKEDNYQEININNIHKIDIVAENIVISTVAHDYNIVEKAKNLLEHNGFATELVFVDVSNEISKLRNEQRQSRGQRMIAESIRFKKYEESKANLEKFQDLFEDVYKVINEEGLHKWFQSRSKDGKRGWVQIGGKYHGKPCARQPGQTSTPKCRSSSEAARMTKDEIAYAVKKKRREDPNQPEKSGAASPTRVATYKKEKKMNEEKDIKGKSSGKKDACYHKVKSRYDVWPSAYASGALVKCRKVGADNWGKKSKIDEKFSKYIDREDTYKREWGTKSLANMYKKDTPGQFADDEMPPRTFPKNPLFEKKKIFKRKKKLEEDGLPSTLDAYNSPYTIGDSGIGAEYGTRYPGSLYGLGSATSVSAVPGMGPAGTLYPFGTYGIAESVIAWANKPETIERFNRKYGELAEQKLIEAVHNLNESADRTIEMPKTFRQLREAWEAIGKRDMGTVPAARSQSADEEMSEDWKKVNRRDKTSGMSPAAVRAYRRENPGSKLQTAVTKDPSKIKSGSKDDKRRKSFCRRMGGMKKRLTSAETARDPDSRINKALRRWNCEE